jgi:putative transposase
VSEKYSFIDAEYENAIDGKAKAAPSIVQMCYWLAVSKSGYHEWRNRPLSAAGKRRELLKLKVKAIFEANNEEYGYRRVHQVLARDGEDCCPELVRSIMRELGLQPCQPKPWRRSLTEQDGQAGPNAVGFRCLDAVVRFRVLVTAGSCLFGPVRPGRWPW